MNVATHWEIALGEEGYPGALTELDDPPDRIFGYGDPALLGGGLAIIGARKATPYGLTCARRFGAWTARQGIPVVSGAAIGCDLESHASALEVHGPTVAVLACGADVDYPIRAGDILNRIRRQGAVISEAPWGSAVHRWSFPRRNRLIAALSSAVLVVEASLPSGTFTTADHALALGRDVYAVPGSIFAPECRGANRLISQGATPITDVSELAHVLGIQGRSTPGTPLRHSADPVLSAIRTNPARPDDLARDLDMDIVSIIRGLTRLEAEGLAVRYSDSRYGITERAAGLLQSEGPTDI